jgi:hypothetical protein
MSTDTTDGRTTDNPQTEEAADSAAERLGGPSKREQRLDMTSDETGARRQAETASMTTDADTTRGAEVASEAEAGALRQGDPGQGDAGQTVRGRADTDAPRETQSGARQAETGEAQQATLIPPDRAESYNSRWNELKGEFVDEPSKAVRGANELVGEVLDELEELFRSQRAELEQGLDSEQTTTEDLRQALGRYRSFFDRLLSF